MQYSLKKLLGLQAFKINEIKEEGRALLFKVVPRRKTGDCPKCKVRSSKIHGYLKDQRIKHIRVGNKVSYLLLVKRRFYCQHCQTVFTETEGINTKLKLIKRISYGFRNKGVFIRKAMLAFLPFAVFSPHLMT